MFLRGPLAAAALAALSACLPVRAHAEIDVRIDKSAQRMTVLVDGHERYAWPVSTGRAGFGTPNGRYHPQWLARTYFSKKYYNSPMPYSIFFHGGFAIHGTHDISRLGGPASHGCVRLTPGHAAKLFALVKEEGMSHTRIAVTGANPVAVARAHELRRVRVEAYDDEPPMRVMRRQRRDEYDRPAYYDVYNRAPVYYHVPYSYAPYGYGYGRSWQYDDD